MDIIKLLPNEIKNKIFQYWAEHPLAAIFKKHIKILYFHVDTPQECFSFKIIDIKRNRDCVLGFNRINEDILASNIYERKIIAHKLLFDSWHKYVRYVIHGSLY